jgi:hypothetical protein
LIDRIIEMINSVTLESGLIRIIKSLIRYYRSLVLGWNGEGISEDLRKDIIKKTFHFADEDDNNNDSNCDKKPDFNIFKL